MAQRKDGLNNSVNVSNGDRGEVVAMICEWDSKTGNVYQFLD